jgi:hypothetical protein
MFARPNPNSGARAILLLGLCVLLGFSVSVPTPPNPDEGAAVDRGAPRVLRFLRPGAKAPAPSPASSIEFAVLPAGVSLPIPALQGRLQDLPADSRPALPASGAPDGRAPPSA